MLMMGHEAFHSELLTVMTNQHHSPLVNAHKLVYHPDHFISDIDKGFSTFYIKLDMSENTVMSMFIQFDDLNKMYKLFVGFKS